jgi:ribosomal protein S18 acetylase RimI-like enzyme
MPLIVRPYAASDRRAFRDLNLAWIEAHFTVEAEDRAQLDDPDAKIIARGGRILIADRDGEAVGTVALVPGHGENTVELIKMCARSDLRGQGVGQKLMDAAIAEAKRMGARHVWLETNTVLEAALALYRKAGFRELPASACSPTPFARCNCQMVLDMMVLDI